VAGQFVSRVFVVLLRKNFPQKHNLQTAAVLSVSEYREMNLYRNLKSGMVLVFFATILSGCCGPCLAPCNPFHKDKAPELKQLSTENIKK
jgi:hypothetical protein